MYDSNISKFSIITERLLNIHNKGSRTSRGYSRGSSLHRLALMLVVLLFAGGQAWGQETHYVLYNSTVGYVKNSNNNLGLSTSFDPSCVWIASGELGSTTRTIKSYTEQSRYINASAGNGNTASLSTTSSAVWLITDDLLCLKNNYYTYYLNSKNGTFTVRRNSFNDRFTVYTVDITDHEEVNTLAYPTISISSISGNTITFSHTDLSGIYSPGYTTYRINNSVDHNWYNNTDNGSTIPTTTNANDLTPTYTWSLTANGGGVATLNTSTGVVTLSGAPTGNITVCLTVSNISPLADKTIDFTLTCASIAQDASTVKTMTNPSVSPASAGLYSTESQAFTSAEVTATSATVTVSAHTTLTHTPSSTVYYYYDGTIYTSTESFSSSVETHPEVTLTWSLSGDGASNLSSSPATGTTTTVTHSSAASTDKTTTLTVTASADGFESKTATATIKVYAPVAAPTITRTGNDISLATTSLDAKIYYTTDESDPASSNTRIAYTGPFALTSSPTPVKAIAERDAEHQSSLAEQTFKLTLPKPVITIDDDGNVTISGGDATQDVTFRFTKGNDLASLDAPTENTETTGASTTLTNMQYIKVIATKSGYTTSGVVWAQYLVSGVSNDGKVIINDLEDHNWSYYQASGDLPTGYPDGLHSPDPRNVIITYQGNGQTIGSTVVSGVKVSIADNETQNTFVYYKTLEKGSDGKYAYTTISNPFSVRPKIESTYYGFDGWEVVSISDGSTIDGYAAGSTIPANTEIKITPSGNYTTNCISTTVVLRAKWAEAEVSTNGSFNNDYGVERMFYVIRNNSTSTEVTANSKAITYTTIYPNGTTDGDTATASTDDIKYRPFGSNNAFTLSKDSRIENYIIYNGSNLVINANNHNLTIGRNVSGNNNGNAAATVKGHNTNGNNNSPFSTNLSYTLCLESGTYGNFYLIDNYSSTVYYNCRISVKGVLGSDYDRARNDNTKLHVAPSGKISSAERFYQQSNSNKDRLVFDWNIKSGKMQENLLNNAGSDYAIYLGAGTSYRYVGKKRLVVEGGEMASIAGGIDSYNLTTSWGQTSSTYTTDDTYVTATLTDQVYIRITNNANTKVRGAIYGAAAYAGSRGGRTFVITGGTINGWIAGGCNGTQSSGGQLYGTTYMYLGGNAKVEHAAEDPYIGGTDNNYGTNGAYGGYIFGAGCGIKPTGYDASNPGNTLNNATVGKVYGSNIALADNLVVSRDVYGGGNFGQVADNSNTTNGGNWSSNSDMTSDIYILGGNIRGNVYGGSNNQKGQTVNITMTGGKVEAGIYGGSNTWGTINKNVTMHIDGGQVGVDAEHPANIHGGGFGSATRVTGSVNLTLGKENATEGVTVYGDVYGGSAEGKTNCNDDGDARTSGAETNVTLNAGTIHGSLYGGGLGNGSNAADVWGPVTVLVQGGKVTDGGAVYGCNNKVGTPKNTVSVTVSSTDATVTNNNVKSYAINAVYGGGNLADYIPSSVTATSPSVTIDDCSSSIMYVYGGGNAAAVPVTNVTINGGDIGYVFGGGNGQNGPAHVGRYTASNTTYGTGRTNVTIHGGTIGQVFGGSNAAGIIIGKPNVSVAETGTTCPVNIIELYGGGNMADSNAGDISIGCASYIGSVYGGAKAANITGDIGLLIEAGYIDNVYGGNNVSGNINGSITVTVNDSGESCGMEIGNVFGGGNEAAYSTYGYNNDGTIKKTGSKLYADPVVEILNGTITSNVYGGGFGNTAEIAGNPTVTIGDSDNNHSVSIVGYVFGGGDAAPVTGDPSVAATGANTTAARLYGGGKGSTAVVTGNTTVSVSNGEYGYVFGGGDEAAMTGSVTVDIGGGTITHDVYGGGALANTNIGNASNYGTASESISSTATYTTAVNLTGGTIQGDAYGGGLGQKSGFNGATSDIPAFVYGDVTITLNGTKFKVSTITDDDSNEVPASGRVFGCNNLYGSPKGTVLVKVTSTSPYSGGGHTKSVYDANGNITTNNYEVQAVYGGGNLAAYDPANPDAEGQYKTNHTATKKPVQVVIDGCGEASIEYVYGGGNAAPVPATDVLILGSFEIGNVFGGGNGKDKFTDGTIWNANDGADVGVKDASHDASGKASGGTVYGTGKALATILGGTIHSVFGASNTKGDIKTSATVVLGDENLETCVFKVGEVYGGGNEAYMSGKADIDMHCIEGLDQIYGGSKKADINGDVVLNITGGSYNKVFGGNNISGTIYGTITVNIEEKGCLPIRIGELYGGGNEAAYSVENIPAARKTALGDNYVNYPQVNVISATEIGTIYGGGLGNTAVVTGNPHVNINMERGKVDGTYHYVSGESPAEYAGYANGTEQTLPLGSVGTVFGGGNAAKVDGSTYVNIGDQTFVDKDNNPVTITRSDANITGNVFGGGNNAIVTGGSNVTIGKTE